MSDLDQLQERLDYRFRDLNLLENALTHRSADGPHNERMEFLGDAVLNFVIAHEVYKRRPEESEGTLSRLRASLVNRSSLAAIARALDLGMHLRLGGGEKKSGGQRRESILADAMEAVFGAIYLDSDYPTVASVITALYRSRLDTLPADSAPKDPKTRLQEALQSNRRPLPAYRVISVTGKAHRQTFRVECAVRDGSETAVAEASSRRQAEQRAAEAMLIEIGIETRSGEHTE